MGQEYLLQVQNVTKQYGEKIALNDFSMDICQGEIVALIGENGAGKTTLLNIICGYCKPSAGQVQYKGKNIVANPLITREFGVLIEPQFLDYISAEENLRLLSQLTNQKQDIRIKELLEKTELYSSRKKKVKEFSFGMKQRLGLCQCLLTEVGFLILDEPFVGLDPIGKELFKQTILDMAHKQNVPVLFSSHDLDDVDEICDRVVMISKGNKQLDQPLEHKQTYTVKIECTISDDIKRSLIIMNLMSYIDGIKYLSPLHYIVAASSNSSQIMFSTILFSIYAICVGILFTHIGIRKIEKMDL